MTPAIAMDVRPGGPTTKRQPSPEGLGKRSGTGSERRRRGTKPTVSLGAKPRDLQFSQSATNPEEGAPLLPLLAACKQRSPKQAGIYYAFATGKGKLQIPRLRSG
jgi:hypothetical protein